MAEIDTLLIETLEKGGSDLHISAGTPPRIRVNGCIEELEYEQLSQSLVEELIREFVPDVRWAQFEGGSDVDMAYEIPEQARFRTNIFRNHWGIAAVFRQIPSRILSIDELGLPQVLKAFAARQNGLVLVTGPTGSGKSTTIAAILNHINENRRKEIITLEDPLEFIHSDKKSTFNHREISTHSHSYERGLRSAMRADPDVILIGEMRDCQTMRLALNCAAMGMLVFATVHTNGAAKTIDRIIDAFPAEEQDQARIFLAESLRGVVSQILCAGIDGARIPAFEILTFHSSLPNLIRQRALNSIGNLIDQSREAGMISLDAYLLDLLNQGRIDKNEAYMKANDKTSFRRD